MNEPENQHDEVPADDQIIALAFRYSLLVFLILGLAVLIYIWMQSSSSQTPTIESAEVAEPEAQLLAQDYSPPFFSFRDSTSAAGIDFVHDNGAYGDKLLPETMGGGVAWFDGDNDGDMDLLLVDSGRWPWHEYSTPAGGGSQFYLNDGKGKFSRSGFKFPVSAKFYGMGVAVGDYDGDGFDDVLITGVGKNYLFRNLSGNGFEDVTATAAVAGDAKSWSTGATFFDFDNDGDLDLYVANYVSWSRALDEQVNYQLTGVGKAYAPPASYGGSHGYLYRNNDGVFTDISQAAGIQVNNAASGLPVAKSLAVMPVDINRDGWVDLLIANDTTRNFVFVNQGGRSFKEQAGELGIAYDNTGHATGAMGIDFALYNARQDAAIAIGNFANEMTSMFVSPSDQLWYSDEAMVTGIGPTSRLALSFGLVFLDVDLDGNLDLIQANGHVESDINKVQPGQHYAQPAQLFWQCGGNCPREFMVVPAASTGDLGNPMVGRGVAYADIDADGDLDLIITQISAAPVLLINETNPGQKWLRVRLAGNSANHREYGARVILETTDGKQERLITPSRSYLSQVEPVASFGLGQNEGGKLSVIWANGGKTDLGYVKANQTLMISR